MATPHIEDEENRVTFVPQLFLQRRAWVLEHIRGEAVKSVLDIGCGEGSLLSCLANSAVCLPPSSSSTTYPEDSEEIHLTKLGGIDIDATELEWAVKAVTPIPAEGDDKVDWLNRTPRWETLDTKIWHSSFEEVNSSFRWDGKEGYECIVSSEVIEHLDPEVFSKFMPIVLGRYRPRLLLLTTPNYTYNIRFRTAGPSSNSDGDPTKIEDAGGYLDPTGRTDRVFRHDDHKFEWTIDEFKEWCQTEAEKYGYEVTVHGVGRCLEGGDLGLGFASQTALFRLQPEPKVRPILVEDAGPTEEKEPIYNVLHTAHPAAGKPRPYPEILSTIKSVFETWDTSQMNIQELWTESSLSIACGGLTEHILKAVREEGSPEDKWRIIDEGRKWDVAIYWDAFIRKGSWIKDGDAAGHPSEDFELEEEFERSVIISEGWDEEEEEERELNEQPGRSSEVEVESLPDNEVGSWSVLSSHSGWGADNRDSVWASQTWSEAAAPRAV